jgi:hypothetical protein
MGETTENRTLSGRGTLGGRDIVVLIATSALVALAAGFFSQSVAIGVVAGVIVLAITGTWTWRTRRSGGDDPRTRATTREALQERRSHPEYGPLRQSGTFGVRVGSGAAGKDNGRG